jgi:hypothetical protein
MRKNLVRYRVKPNEVAENERLVKEVYKQLHHSKIEGFHYATFKMPDGVSFVHIALADNDDAHKAFGNLSAFKDFQSNIKDRCDELPVVSLVTEIGSYNFTHSIQ